MINEKSTQTLNEAIQQLLKDFSPNQIKQSLHEITKNPNPVNNVQFISISEIQANDYNPNSVAKVEMGLLYLSIKEDGYTQPIVVTFDPEIQKYIIVDGFHRFTTMRINKDLQELNNSCVPCVILNKDINQRMASTVRHNRARGKHSVDGMSNMVFQMLENGMSDVEICNKLGMDTTELVKLKHITGFSKLFKDAKYSKAWVTSNQIRIEKEYNETNKS